MYSFRLRDTMMSICIRKVTISPVRCSEIPRIVDYLIAQYFTEEPLSKYLKLTECPNAVEFLRNFCAEALQENISIVATTEDGEIAGVSCNMILWQDKEFHFGVHPEIKKIISFVTKIIDECDIYGKYPDLGDYMYIAFMSVHESFRKQGLSKHLLAHTKDLATKLGLTLMRMDCCSLYTAKIAQSLGWTLLKEIEYKDYHVNGKEVFNPDEPHTSFGVYVMKIK